MITFYNLKEITDYDICVMDALADELTCIDNKLKFKSDMQDVYAPDGRSVVLNCVATKPFEQDFKLKDLCALFNAGTLHVSSDGKKVTVTLASNLAKAHGSVRRIYLSVGATAGINGFTNNWIDTEDDIENKLELKFIVVDPLPATSSYLGKSLCEYGQVTINTSSISHIVESNYYDYLEWAETHKKK